MKDRMEKDRAVRRTDRVGRFVRRISLAAVLAVCASQAFGRTERVELNDGWRFSPDETLGPSREFPLPAMLDMLDGMRRDLLEVPLASSQRQGYQPGETHPFLKTGFKDDSWASVRVPHDAGIAHSFSYDLQPFDAYMPGTGTAWYRYRFKVEKLKRTGVEKCAGVRIVLPDGKTLSLEKNGRLFFDCDGAMAFPMLWLNGKFVGGWPNGYMPWYVDLTDCLKTDGENVLAIRTHRPENYARWHTGVGLTRRCWFVTYPEDHLVMWFRRDHDVGQVPARGRAGYGAAVARRAGYGAAGASRAEADGRIGRSARCLRDVEGRQEGEDVYR